MFYAPGITYRTVPNPLSWERAQTNGPKLSRPGFCRRLHTDACLGEEGACALCTITLRSYFLACVFLHFPTIPPAPPPAKSNFRIYVPRANKRARTYDLICDRVCARFACLTYSAAAAYGIEVNTSGNRGYSSRLSFSVSRANDTGIRYRRPGARMIGQRTAVHPTRPMRTQNLRPVSRRAGKFR